MRRPLAEKLPAASVVVVSVVPDGSWTTVTVAPPTGPESLDTVPRTEELVSCAWTGAARRQARETLAAPAASKYLRCIVVEPQFAGPEHFGAGDLPKRSGAL